jgi:hypothetical protein
MAAITSTAAGFYDVGSTWTGGVVPVQGDTATISHKVTIRDARSIGTDPGSASNPANFAASVVLTIAAGGELYASRVANSTLTVYGSITTNSNTSTLNYGTDTTCVSPYNVADPIPDGVNATIRFATAGNNVLTGKYGFADTAPNAARVFLKGLNRVTNSVLSNAYSIGAGSIVIADGTNWKVGDRFAIHTSDSTSGNIEVFGVRTVTGTIPATIGLGTVAVPATAATLAAAHVINTPVTNFSSNVTVGFSSTNYCFFTARVSASVSGINVLMKNASFEYINTPNGLYSSPYSGVGINIDGSPLTQTETIDDCTVWLGNGGFAKRGNSTCSSTYNRLAVYSTASQGAWFNWNSCIVVYSFCVGYNTQGNARVSAVALGLGGYATYNDCFLATGILWGTNQSAGVILNRTTFGCAPRPIPLAIPTIKCNSCNFGTFGTQGIQTALTDVSGATVCFPTMVDCNFVSGIVIQDGQMQAAGAMTPESYLLLTNYNADTTQQQKHTKTGPIIRNNSQLIRSRSSIQFFPLSANTVHKETYLIPGAAGVPVTIRPGLRYDTNYTNATPPTVVVSGLGITPQTFTAGSSVNTDYEQTITVTPVTTGSLSVVVSGQSANTNGSFFFSGVSVASWIDWTFHYGYVFNPTSPTQKADVVIVSSLATAAALTGVSYGSGTLTVTGNRSPREIYDWVNWYCAVNYLDLFIDSSDGVTFALAANLTINGGSITGNSSTFDIGNRTFTKTGGGDTDNKIIVNGVTNWNIYLTVTGLSGAYLAISNSSGTQVAYTGPVTGTYTYKIPAGSTGTWSLCIRRQGYTARTLSFNGASTVQLSIDGTLVQATNFDGSATYTGTTSSDCTIALNSPSAGQVRADLQAAVASQIVFNMLEDALVTSAGICLAVTAKYLADPLGFALFAMSTNLQLRRWHSGDVNAKILGIISQAGGTAVDTSNGGVDVVGTPIMLTKQDVRDAEALALTVGVTPATGSLDDKLATNLAATNALPSASTTAAAVRTNLATELARMDINVGSRSTYAGTDTAGTTTLLTRVTGPLPLASDYTSVRAAKLDNLDAAISAGLTAAQVWAYSTRTITSGGITLGQIEASTILAMKADVTAIPAAVWAYGTRTITSGGITLGQIEASTVLAMKADVVAVPAAVWGYSTRTITSGGITLGQIEASTILAMKADVTAVPAATWAYATRTLTSGGGGGGGGATLAEIEASTVLAKEATVAARPVLTTIEASTILAKAAAVAAIPVNPLLTNDTRLNHLDADISAVASAVWSYSTRTITSGGITLGQIEASTILAKEATGQSIKAKTDHLPTDPASESLVEAKIDSVRTYTPTTELEAELALNEFAADIGILELTASLDTES